MSLRLIFILASLVAPSQQQQQICKPPMQLRVARENATLAPGGIIINSSSHFYAQGTFWEDDDELVLCTCRMGRCIAKCSNLYKEDGQKFETESSLDFLFKIENTTGPPVIVNFSQYFHIFDERPRSLPYYFLIFEASLDPTKLETNKAFPPIYNETAAGKVCFMVDGERLIFLEAPLDNYKDIAQLFVIWIVNACCLAALVVALHKAGDTKTVYGKCLIRHVLAMMLANLSFFLCTQLYLLGTLLPSWLCYTLGFLTYYFQMCVLFWLTSLLHGICLTFNSLKGDNLKAPLSKGRFRFYALISWVCPFILTVLLVATVFFINNTYSLHSGILYSHFSKFKYRYTCFVTKWETTYFIFKLMPEIIFVVLNTCFFGRTAFSIYRAQKEVQAVLKLKTPAQIRCYSFMVFLKLFSLMGVTRIVEIICWFVFYQKINLFIMILEAVGSLQGLWLVFFCLLTKEKVRAVFLGWVLCSKEVSANDHSQVSFKSRSSGKVNEAHLTLMPPSKNNL